MSKYFYIAVAIVFIWIGSSFSSGSSIDTLLDAMQEVESHNNANAIGDNGRAVGVLQIHPIMIEDVNRILKKEVYTLKDRYSVTKSRQIAKVFFNHYCKDKSSEYMARCWVGGPQGYKKSSTLDYWNKVKTVLERK